MASPKEKNLPPDAERCVAMTVGGERCRRRMEASVPMLRAAGLCMVHWQRAQATKRKR